MDTLKIKFRGIEYGIKKDEIVFENGYAVVSKLINYNGIEAIIRGVLNKNYEIIYDFEAFYDKIDIFKEGKMIVTCSYITTDNIRHKTSYLLNIEKNKVRFLEEFGFEDYKKVNDNIIKVYENNTYYLYDLQAESKISKPFDYMSDFVDIDGKKYAKAIKRVNFSDEIKLNDFIICYIDSEGKRRSSIYDYKMEQIKLDKVSDDKYDTYLDKDIEKEKIRTLRQIGEIMEKKF